MVKHKFLSIDDQGGIETYLNDRKALHNGLGYADLEERLKLRVPKRRIAEDFHIGEATLNRWIEKVNARRTKD